MGLLLVVAAIGSESIGGRTAQAATVRVWTGAAGGTVGGYWSTPGNWSPAGAPVDGDSLVFDASSTTGNAWNDLGSFDIINNKFVPLRVASLTVSRNLHIIGQRFAVSGAITVNSPAEYLEIDATVVLAANVQANVAGSGTLRLQTKGFAVGTVSLETAGHTLTKTGLGDLEVNFDVVGGGTIATQAGTASIYYPIAFGGTLAMSPDTSLKFSVSTIGSGHFCGGAASAAILLNGAKLSVNCSTSVGSVTGNGTFDIGGAATTLTLAAPGDTFYGVINGGPTAKIVCCALGVQTLIVGATFTGTMLVTSGSLLFAGATFPAASLFTVQGKGNFPAGLGGYGTFGVSSLSIAILDLNAVNGKFGLAQFPQLVLGPDVEVDYEFVGTRPGSGFTQIVTTDKVDIDNARLSLDFGSYVPAPGQSFTLIKGFTSGVFRNVANDAPLPEGAVFSASGMQFKISYNGAADDVIITRQGAGSTPTATPTPTTPQLKNKRILPNIARDN